jgi:hypothetical protein
MDKSCYPKKSKKPRGTFYFIAFAAITTIACIYFIKEGKRIKKENELLSYEVW